MNFGLYRTVLGSALFVGLAFFLVGAGELINDVSQSLQRPSYDFLPHLRINVASLKVIDDATPLPQNESREMAYTPNELLKDLAKQRFICEGKAGEAVLNIRQASLTRHPDKYDGKIILSLTMENPAFSKTGNLSAEVYKSVTPIHGEKDSDVLLRLTNALLDDMNVEIEYQLRSKFSNWIVKPVAATKSTIPVSDNVSGIQAQPLPALPVVQPIKKGTSKATTKDKPKVIYAKSLQPLPPPPSPRAYH
ncbi:hypothetical protein FAI41_02015 [Acetobacteraceae bacterium]|nr:hypothetical protein FAI41_02015 [Acetobacteraceae bacterium]